MIRKNRLAPAMPLMLSNVEVGNGKAEVGSGLAVEEPRAVDVELGACDTRVGDVEI